MLEPATLTAVFEAFMPAVSERRHVVSRTPATIVMLVVLMVANVAADKDAAVIVVTVGCISFVIVAATIATTNHTSAGEGA
jgi:hypothetical protein